MSKGIIRVSKTSNYVVLDKGFLNDEKLSWKAKGLLAYMLSKPDDWTFYLKELEKHASDGETSLRNGFKELQDNGYVTRERERQSDGTFKWITTVHEITTRDFPQVDNPQVEKPQVENHELLNNKELSNKELNNDKDIYAIFEYWNSKGIIVHRKMNAQMKSHIKARLQEYTFEELKKSIDNYSIILNSDKYYWTHKWSLQDFMRPNNAARFVDENRPFENFRKDSKSKGTKLIKEVDF